MKIIDCKPYFSKREYNSLSMFLTNFNCPTHSEMTKVHRIDRHSNETLMAINVYDNNEVKRVALERLEKPRSGLLRRTVLRKLIQLIDKGLI